jgi:hypothetical protein
MEIDMTHDSHFQLTWNLAAHAIRHTTRRAHAGFEDNEPRQWWVDLANKYKLHPVVFRIINEGVRPMDWHQLLLEWPHVSTEDEAQIAYTRDEAKGKADVQTRTSIGKYLSRHWPHVADHVRRDWAGTFSPAKYEMRDTMEGIISGIEMGPQSCMKSSQGSIPFNDVNHEQLVCWQTDKSVDVPWHRHPYSVYDPKLGWRMAVRIDPGRPDIVMARALVFIDDDNDSKVFVRSYQRNSAGDHCKSGSDEKLETWLRDQGVCKQSEWDDGTPVKRMEHPKGGLMMPYLDGNTQTVEERKGYLVIYSDGDIECTNTDGTTSENSGIGECEDCGAVIHEDDDYIHAGYHEDRLVCDCCRSEYTYVEGDRGRGVREYYVRDEQAIEVSGGWYDSENLPDCIVGLHDGACAHQDDAVYIYSQEKYYRTDDKAVCCTADGDWELRDDCVKCDDGEWRLEEDCVMCDDGEWRLEEDCVEVDGVWYEEGTEPDEDESEEIDETQTELPLGETK